MHATAVIAANSKGFAVVFEATSLATCG